LGAAEPYWYCYSTGKRDGDTRVAQTIQAVIIAKLDRHTRSVKDLCELLEPFERCGVALIAPDFVWPTRS
jgi:DNA invertase Pin-like site-specific DNA recombinase